MSDRCLITADELWQRLNDTARPVVLDVRWALGDPHGREHFEARRIPDSVYVDLDTELAAGPSPAAGRHPLPEVDDLQASARRWGVRRDSEVVVLDDNGGLSAARAWWLLRWAGLRSVRVLDGGLRGWAAAGYGVEDGSTHPALALAIAGIDSALYAGSWSQWSNDSRRAVAAGPERG